VVRSNVQPTLAVSVLGAPVKEHACGWQAEGIDQKFAERRRGGRCRGRCGSGDAQRGGRQAPSAGYARQDGVGVGAAHSGRRPTWAFEIPNRAARGRGPGEILSVAQRRAKASAGCTQPPPTAGCRVAACGCRPQKGRLRGPRRPARAARCTGPRWRARETRGGRWIHERGRYSPTPRPAPRGAAAAGWTRQRAGSREGQGWGVAHFRGEEQSGGWDGPGGGEDLVEEGGQLGAGEDVGVPVQGRAALPAGPRVPRPRSGRAGAPAPRRPRRRRWRGRRPRPPAPRPRPPGPRPPAARRGRARPRPAARPRAPPPAKASGYRPGPPGRRPPAGRRRGRRAPPRRRRRPDAHDAAAAARRGRCGQRARCAAAAAAAAAASAGVGASPCAPAAAPPRPPPRRLPRRRRRRGAAGVRGRCRRLPRCRRGSGAAATAGGTCTPRPTARAHARQVPWPAPAARRGRRDARAARRAAAPAPRGRRRRPARRARVDVVHRPHLGPEARTRVEQPAHVAAHAPRLGQLGRRPAPRNGLLSFSSRRRCASAAVERLVQPASTTGLRRGASVRTSRAWRSKSASRCVRWCAAEAAASRRPSPPTKVAPTHAPRNPPATPAAASTAVAARADGGGGRGGRLARVRPPPSTIGPSAATVEARRPQRSVAASLRVRRGGGGGRRPWPPPVVAARGPLRPAVGVRGGRAPGGLELCLEVAIRCPSSPSAAPRAAPRRRRRPSGHALVRRAAPPPRLAPSPRRPPPAPRPPREPPSAAAPARRGRLRAAAAARPPRSPARPPRPRRSRLQPRRHEARRQLGVHEGQVRRVHRVRFPVRLKQGLQPRGLGPGPPAATAPAWAPGRFEPAARASARRVGQAAAAAAAAAGARSARRRTAGSSSPPVDGRRRRRRRPPPPPPPSPIRRPTDPRPA